MFTWSSISRIWYRPETKSIGNIFNFVFNAILLSDSMGRSPMDYGIKDANKGPPWSNKSVHTPLFLIVPSGYLLYPLSTLVSTSEALLTKVADRSSLFVCSWAELDTKDKWRRYQGPGIRPPWHSRAPCSLTLSFRMLRFTNNIVRISLPIYQSSGIISWTCSGGYCSRALFPVVYHLDALN